MSSAWRTCARPPTPTVTGMPEDSFFSSQVFDSREPVDVSPPPGVPADEEKPKPSRTRRIVLLVFGLAAVAALAAGAVYGIRIWSQQGVTLTTPASSGPKKHG